MLSGHSQLDAVNLNEVDFEFVTQCRDVRHLRRVIQALEKESFPDLLRCAKQRLIELQPNSLEAMQQNRVPLSTEEMREIHDELEQWQQECRDMEKEALDAAPLDTTTEARYRRPVRGMPGKHGQVEPIEEKSCAARKGLAMMEKDKGNEYFRCEDYSTAIRV